MSIAAALAVTVAFVIASVGAYTSVRSELRNQVDDSLRERVSTTQAEAGQHQDLTEITRLPGASTSAARFGAAGGLVQINLPDGSVRTIPPGNERLPIEAAAAASLPASGVVLSDEKLGGESFRVATARLAGGATVQVARPLGEVDDALHRLLVLLALLAAGGVGLAAGLGAVVARTSLAPVRRFTERTEEIAGHPGLGERLPVASEDELGRLARSFNATLDALERSLEAQRGLVSDASHELRTPLTSLRTNVELLADDAALPPGERRSLAADLVEQINELTMLVDDVVELARRGELDREETEEVPLEEVVNEAIERAQRHAPAVEFRADLKPWTILAAPQRVNRAVYNLLDNAAKWTPEGGVVAVELREGELTVRDQGPGFEPEDLPHVFDRFYRAAGARNMPGSGLGLAIVKQVVEAQGGSVSAENAPGGGGLLRTRFSNGAHLH
jgi:two-component system sensor histidine kinase MprB